MAEETEIIVRVDAQGAITTLNKLGEEVGKVEQSTENAGEGLGVFGSALSFLQSPLGLATAAMAALTAATAALIPVINRGSEVSDVAESFGTLTEAAGETADVFLNKLVTATGNTISNFDLQKQAIEAVRAGAKPDEFLKLTEAARVLAEQTGGSTKDAMDQLSNAFETGRVKSLKNALGVIDLEKAEDDLAKQLGVTREALSAEGKVQAARTALLEASTRATAQFGKITNDAGDNLAVFKTAFDNAYDNFAKAISENKALNGVLSDLAEIVKNIDFTPIINGISKTIDVAVKAIKIIAEFAQGLVRSLKEVGQALSDFINDTSQSERITNAGRIALFELSKQTFSYNNQLSKVNKELEKQVEILPKITNSVTGLTSNLINQEDVVKKNADAVKKMADEYQKYIDKLDDDILKNIEDQIALTEKQIALNEKKLDQIDEEIAKQEELGKAIGSAIEQGVADALKAVLTGDQAGLEGILGSLGSTVGGAIGGPIGSVIGQFIGDSLTEGIKHAFSGRDASGAIRDGLDRFFADAFATNPLLAVIDGELRKITDLDFFRNTDLFENGAFDNFLEGLPGKSQEAFSGVGLALGEILGATTDVASQLGAIFAQNLSGDLNALQLLVQSTGKSFEEMKDAVVEAFLDGKLSALEAQSALQGIQQIAQKGIPGALGAVDKAFENLVNAGTKGGRALVDALQDIGIEANELGVKDFTQLAAIIQQKTGASAEDIEHVFQSLREHGIDTVQELADATAEQLLPTLANLQATEFPFKEAADDVQGLIEQVNSMPDRIEKRLNFVVNTQYTGSTRDAVEKGVFNQGNIKLPAGNNSAGAG